MKLFLGIDVGYGDTKIIGQAEGGIMFKYAFPSVWRQANDSAMGIRVASDNLNVSEKYALIGDRGEKFVLGYSAGYSISRRFTGNSIEEYRLFVKMALGIAAMEHNVRKLQAFVTIGRPLNSKKEFANSVKADLKNIREIRIVNDLLGKDYVIQTEVRGAYALEQAKGIVFSLVNFRKSPNSNEVLIDKDALHYTNKNILIIDIGNNTINPLFVLPKFKVDKNRSTAVFGVGVKNIVTELRAVLQSKYDLRTDDEAIQEDILKKNPVNYQGIDEIRQIRKEAINRAWNNIVEPEVRKIIEEAQDVFKGKLQNVIFSGGGTELFWDRIVNSFEKGRLHIVKPSNPMFANAHGYFLYSKYKGKVEGE